MSAYKEYLKNKDLEKVPSLKEFYKDDFRMGVAVAPYWLHRPDCDQTVRRHFNSLSAENNMKPCMLLDREATLASGSQVKAVFNFTLADELLSYAKENGMGVRFHVLVWHNQTPRWFFAENWSDAEDAPLCDRDTMIARLQNSIADEMDYVNEKWPGIVYAWDVVNEAIEPDHQAPGLYRTKSFWYQILGEEFVPLAFREAKKHRAQGQKLYYNDFNMAQPNKAPAVYEMVKKLVDEGTIDGVGFQTHIGLDYPDYAYYEEMVKKYAALGLTIQSTEMDIRVGSAGAASQMKLAVRYRDYFAMMRRLRREGVDIDSITLWGLADDHSWLMGWNGPTYPLFFDGLMRPKAAFFGAMLDESIPATMEEIDLDDTLPPETEEKPYTAGGVLNSLNPDVVAGVTAFPDKDGKPVLFSQVPQAWLKLNKVQLNGAKELVLAYGATCPAKISVMADDVKAEAIAAMDIQREFNYQEITFALPETLKGEHDLYVLFSTPCVRVKDMQLK